MFLDLDLSSNEKLIFIVVTIAALIGLIWLMFRRLGHYRLITGTPTALIRSASQGYTELKGTAVAYDSGPIYSPLTGLQCLWYRFRISERESDSDNKVRWNVRRSESSEALFKIQDSTGECVVDPEKAEVSAKVSRTWYSNEMTVHEAVMANNINGYAASLGLGGNRYKYEEWLIVDGEPLYVLGQFRSQGNGRERLDEKRERQRIIKEWKQRPEQMVERFDTNGDGKIDMQEWEDALKVADKEVKKAQLALDTNPTTHFIEYPTNSGQPLLISTYNEEQLVRRMRWQIWLSGIGIVLALLFLSQLLMA